LLKKVAGNPLSKKYLSPDTSTTEHFFLSGERYLSQDKNQGLKKQGNDIFEALITMLTPKS
jgi:hypothetical protein